MKRPAVFVSCICAIAFATPGWALDGHARVECLNGNHRVTITGTYHEEIDGEFVGIVLQREAIGVCVEDGFVPEEPLPFLPQFNPDYDYPTYEAVVTIDPPLDGVAYRYKPFGVRPDGSLVSVHS